MQFTYNDNAGLSIISAPTDFETIYSVLEKGRMVIVRAALDTVVLYYCLTFSSRTFLTFYNNSGTVYGAPNIFISLEEDGTTKYDCGAD